MKTIFLVALFLTRKPANRPKTKRPTEPGEVSPGADGSRVSSASCSCSLSEATSPKRAEWFRSDATAATGTVRPPPAPREPRSGQPAPSQGKTQRHCHPSGGFSEEKNLILPPWFSRERSPWDFCARFYPSCVPGCLSGGDAGTAQGLPPLPLERRARLCTKGSQLRLHLVSNNAAREKAT